MFAALSKLSMITISFVSLIFTVVFGIICYQTFPFMLIPLKLIVTILTWILAACMMFGAIFSGIFAVIAIPAFIPAALLLFDQETGFPKFWSIFEREPLTTTVFYSAFFGWLFWLTILSKRTQASSQVRRQPSQLASKGISYIAVAIAIVTTVTLYKTMTLVQFANMASWLIFTYFCVVWLNCAMEQNNENWGVSFISFFFIAALSLFFMENHNNLILALKTLQNIPSM